MASQVASNSETEKAIVKSRTYILTACGGWKRGQGNTQVSQSCLGDGESDMRKTVETRNKEDVLLDMSGDT